MEKSYNGWPASKNAKEIGVASFVVDGRSFPGGVKSGDVEVVMRYVVEQFAQRVEDLGNHDKAVDDEWGYAYRKNRNADNLSCHASGTAVDVNSEKHPNGKTRTFTDAQVGRIHAILREVDNVIKWGGDFQSTVDQMHFEVHGTAAQVKTVADRLRNSHPTAERKQQKMTKDVASKPTPKWWKLTVYPGEANQEVASACKVLKVKARVTLDQDLANRFGYIQKQNKLVVTYALDEATAKCIGG